MGQLLRLWVFKRSTADFEESLQELQEDQYGLRDMVPKTWSTSRGSEAWATFAVDVGASVGMFAILIAKLWAGARVIQAQE